MGNAETRPTPPAITWLVPAPSASMTSPAAATARVVVVVVNHGSAAATTAALRRLWADEPDVQAVVVDNSEGERDAALLGDALGSRAVVRRVSNRGFGAACNEGIAEALARGASHVLLLNPDTLPEAGALARMLETFARHPEAGAVGARLVSMDGARVLFEHGRIRRWLLTRCHARARGTEREARTEFVTGACMLLAADLLREGLRFDEGYFLYVEDMDLCCAIAARGRTLWINRDAVVRHAEGGTQGEEPVLGTMRARQLYWATAGKVRFARKWLTPWQRACFWLVAVGLKPLAGVLLAGGAGFVRAYFAGLRDGLRASWPAPGSAPHRGSTAATKAT